MMYGKELKLNHKKWMVPYISNKGEKVFRGGRSQNNDHRKKLMPYLD
jgi:hypothetical protein